MARKHMQIIGMLIVLMLAAGAAGCSDSRDIAKHAGEGKPPNYPWSSFMRFWNSRTPDDLEILNPVAVNDTWVAQYHSSVSLIAVVHKKVVRSVSAAFVDPKDEATGGQIWLRLVRGIITVGTYGWPQDRIDTVKEKFTAISPAPVEYGWRYSLFRREFSPLTGWVFTLEFLDKPFTGQ